MVQPSDNQVLITVAAVSINRPDVFQRKGFYPAPPGVTDMPASEFKPHHAYEYREGIHQSHSAGCANKDLETLSHVFTTAVEWGADMRHPIKDTVRKLTTKRSDCYVTDDELDWFLSVSNHFLNVYCPLKLATGKDQIMLSKLQT